VTDPVLEIRDLVVTFPTDDGPVQAVRGVNLEVAEREVLGIVGESGSGKSVTMLAAMGLLPRSAKVTGSVKFRGTELVGLGDAELRQYRGSGIAMIFQDALTALNPVFTVGDQISEGIRAHDKTVSKRERFNRAVELLELVGIPNPRERVKQHPHQFSGGMRQRAMIAMAMANDPDVLIADEPTTALDVTIQAQVLEVIERVQEATGTAVVMITHDLGVIARVARRTIVMYAGEIAESGYTEQLFAAPRHPYTLGLLRSLPRLDGLETVLSPIEGSPPNMLAPPSGCAFHPRCFLARQLCRSDDPVLRGIETHDHMAACHYAEELEGIAVMVTGS
jgi:oligopeptide/dipeptide ABC transporter ATP-binding protein